MTLITPVVVPIPNGMTLTPHIHAYLVGRHERGEITAGTLEQYRYALGHFAHCFGERPLSHLTEPAVDRWLRTLGQLAPATRRRHISTVRTFCRWMLRAGRIKRDPTVEIEPVRQPRRHPRTLTHAEVARVLAVAPDDRARAILWLMVGCGLRRGEVAALDVSDYDPVARTLVVEGKGGHQRMLPVPEVVARALDAYLDGRVVGGPLVRSRSGNGRGLAPATIGAMVREWMRVAGVKQAPLDGRSAHALRRTCASDVMDVSGDIRVVQELLGHRFVETTAQHYLRPVSLGQLRDAMESRPFAA